MPVNKWFLISVGIFILVILPFCYLWSLASRYDKINPENKHYDIGIVLGAALWNGQPSPALKERCNLAIELYHSGKVDRLILSGGLGQNSITEAEGMRQYLIERGVKNEHLILEDRSTNTKENLLFTSEILQNQKYHTLVLITHDYHMHRAINYAHQVNLTPDAAPVHSKVLFTPYHKTRECLALVKQLVFKK
jgi:uncharacterized SAM-binding protein YcdF (DUF218 family)